MARTQSTTLRVDSSSTDDSRFRGALPLPDSCTAQSEATARPVRPVLVVQNFMPPTLRSPVLYRPVGQPPPPFLGTFHNPWQPDREGRATTWLACDRDVATHHLTEAFADREPKARASVTVEHARRGAIPCQSSLELTRFRRDIKLDWRLTFSPATGPRSR